MDDQGFDRLASAARKGRWSRRRLLQTAGGALAALGIGRVARPPAPVLSQSLGESIACEVLAQQIVQVNQLFARLIARFPWLASRFEAQRTAVVEQLQTAMQQIGCDPVGQTGSAYEVFSNPSVSLGSFEKPEPDTSGPAGPPIGST